jgi:hypothetical protein
LAVTAAAQPRDQSQAVFSGFPCRDLVHGGGAGAHAGGFGYAEVGVDVQGVLPVLACPAELAGGVAGLGQAAMGAGLPARKGLVFCVASPGPGNG